MSMQEELIRDTERGYFVVYLIDKGNNTYEQTLKMNINALHENGAPPGSFWAAMKIFDMIKDHFVPGNYLCVFKDFGTGTEWWTREPDKTVAFPKKKPKKPGADFRSWFRKMAAI